MNEREEINRELNKLSLLRDHLATTGYIELQKRAEKLISDFLQIKEGSKVESD